MSDHLLFDDHPAISTPTTVSAVIAVMYRIPILRSARIKSDENGITAHGRINANTTRYGANLNSGASASSGIMSSLQTCLIPSASHCRKPFGPTRFGPTRDWIRAHTRRSTQVTIDANGTAMTNSTRTHATAIEAATAHSRDASAANIARPIKVTSDSFIC